jgi:hypothetical protein
MGQKSSPCRDAATMKRREIVALRRSAAAHSAALGLSGFRR